MALKQTKEWIRCNIVFVAWHRYWKGIYIHFIPFVTIRIFLWGIDWHTKPRRIPNDT